MAVQIGPAALHHADFGVDEIGHGSAQKIRRRQKIGVKDGHKFAGGGLESLGECAGFVAGAIGRDVDNELVKPSACYAPRPRAPTCRVSVP